MAPFGFGLEYAGDERSADDRHPRAVQRVAVRFSKRRMPKNLFLFVLWNGFLCGAMAVALNTLAASLLLLLLSKYNWGEVQHHYLMVAPIIMLTEAFLTGMLITAFTVFQPQAVMNFSDAEYIDGK